MQINNPHAEICIIRYACKVLVTNLVKRRKKKYEIL